MEERFDAEYLIALVVAVSLISLIALIAVALTVMRCRHRLQAAAAEGEKRRQRRSGRHGGGQRRQSNSSVDNSSGSSGGGFAGGVVGDEEKRSIIRCLSKKSCTVYSLFTGIELTKYFFQVPKRRREHELQRRRRQRLHSGKINQGRLYYPSGWQERGINDLPYFAREEEPQVL